MHGEPMSEYQSIKTTIVTIPTSRITDWDSFHGVFQTALGFPGFYGRNMNAWIDCLTYLDDGMTRFTVADGDTLTLRIDDADGFASRCPEQYLALIECAAFVNFRRREAGLNPGLSLLLSGSFNRD